MPRVLFGASWKPPFQALGHRSVGRVPEVPRSPLGKPALGAAAADSDVDKVRISRIGIVEGAPLRGRTVLEGGSATAAVVVGAGDLKAVILPFRDIADHVVEARIGA